MVKRGMGECEYFSSAEEVCMYLILVRKGCGVKTAYRMSQRQEEKGLQALEGNVPLSKKFIVAPLKSWTLDRLVIVSCYGFSC